MLKVIIYSKLYIPILLTVCKNISMKNVTKFIKSVKPLNVKMLNVNVKLNILWFLLIKFYYLLLAEMTDWNWHSIVSFSSNQELLVPVSQSSYLIYFYYNFFNIAKETNMYKHRNKIEETTLPNIDLFYFSSFIFKKITKKHYFRKKI